MLRISKDNDHSIVTRGVYESIYKPLGYTIDSENKKEVKKPKTDYEERKEISTKNYSKSSRK